MFASGKHKMIFVQLRRSTLVHSKNLWQTVDVETQLFAKNKQ